MAASGTGVPPEEDLRRAVWPQQLDPDTGYATSAPFNTQNMSVDVASLAELGVTRGRFPKSYTAIVRCQVFLDVGHPSPPEHQPLAENPAHAIVPGRLSKARARKVALAVSQLYPPVDIAVR